MDHFIILSFIASVGVSVITAILGCFIIWRKMAYFGDSLAHSALLGISLAIIFNISHQIGIIITSIVFSSIFLYLQNKNILSNDSLLGMLAHSSLAIAIVIISLFNDPSLDLDGLLFGDILFVSTKEVILIYIVFLIVILLLSCSWQKLILITISKELSISKNINYFYHEFIFLALVTLVVSVSIKIVGVLLITSMMIIPAASSRLISSSPKEMAIFAILLSILSSILGFLSSYHFDIPTGPSMILFSTIIFSLTFYLKKIFN